MDKTASDHKKLVGRSLNAISIQIYSALIIYVLLLIIKHKFESSLSIFNIFRKLSSNILETYALRNILLRWTTDKIENYEILSQAYFTWYT